MSELVRKVPSHEWKARMQRALTTLELYKRENLRLRREAHRSGHTPAPTPAEALPSSDSPSDDPGTVLFSGGGAAGGGVSEGLLDELEEMRQRLSEARAEALAARKLQASREAYLASADAAAAEMHARNEAQHGRLEHLTGENSRLRREGVKLRADAAKDRMEAFEAEMIRQELRAAQVRTGKGTAVASAMQQDLVGVPRTPLARPLGLRQCDAAASRPRAQREAALQPPPQRWNQSFPPFAPAFSYTLDPLPTTRSFLPSRSRPTPWSSSCCACTRRTSHCVTATGCIASWRRRWRS